MIDLSIVTASCISCSVCSLDIANRILHNYKVSVINAYVTLAVVICVHLIQYTLL